VKISNQTVLGGSPSKVDRLRHRVTRPQLHKKIKMPKLSAWMVYSGVFISIIAVIAVGYQPPREATQATTVANTTQTPETTPIVIEGNAVDKIVATDVASNIAEQTNMSVAENVAERAASLAIENELAQTDTTAIIKPQIVQPTASNRDVVVYTVKKGDTMATIANAYGVSSETIRWANDMTNNNVSVGKKLKIPPVDGVLYTVKSSDTLDKLAQTYNANKARIISYNDLEISGLKAGTKIIIPGGDLPETQRPGYVAPQVQTQVQPQQNYVNYGTGFGGTSWRIKVGTPGLAGNSYAYGNCTRYAYDRRIELGLGVGRNWGNAATWSSYAASEGYRVDNTPSRGAIIQNAGGYGHVGIVEQVKPNGDVVVSEMNAYVSGGGWNVVNGRIIPANQARYYAYIH
jgi:N-acetylmuramoyl-L-alanine amidase